MSPRHASRDMTAVQVRIHPFDLGSGQPQEGGGPLRGGLSLMNRFTADIDDPALPYLVTMTLRARDGVLACESLTITERANGPTVTGIGLRSVVVDSYVRRVRQVLGDVGGGLLIAKQSGRTMGTVSHEGPVSEEEWDAFDSAQKSRATQLTPELIATYYREALASPDPMINRRPTAAVAERVNASRGHISRLLTRAREQDLLGPASRGRAGESTPPRKEQE